MLPLNVLILIAKTDLASYRSMLALPRFARFTLRRNVEFRWHFTVKTIDLEGSQRWYLNGSLHREDDLPAVISVYDSQYWYQYDKLHRDNDLPAIIYASGDQCWYQHNELHRENNLPAIVRLDLRSMMIV